MKITNDGSFRFAAAALLAAWLTLGGCSKSASGGKEGPGPKEADSVAIKWRTVEITAPGKKSVAIEVGRLEKPTPKLIALNQTRRDTPLNTWISMQCYEQQGKDDKDLRAYEDHFLTGQEHLKKIDAKNAPKFFEDARKTYDHPVAVGLIKHGQYTLVISSVSRAGQDGKSRKVYLASCMVSRSGRYYVDDKAKLRDPVLAQLAQDDYKVIKDVPK